MGKNLSPIWFLKDPLDPEHKEYVLLDYLKSISKGLDQTGCFSVARGISRLIKAMNDYKKDGEIGEFILELLKKDDIEFLENLITKGISEKDSEVIKIIIDNSLETLYGYSEICLEMIKEEESKIKIFKIQSKFHSSLKGEDSGVVIIRNMITDNILNYFFKTHVILKMEDSDKEIFILKKAPIKNQTFSLNYEYVYHEVLNEFSLDSVSFPHLYVIEIYENFDEESEIYKIAKEKFIETVSGLT